MKMTRILVIRHGETEWNVSGRWQGTTDIELNDLGREQARRLARYLRGRDLSAIYSSDLSRAAETAQIIAAPHGLTPTLDARWRELNLGVWQGLTKDQIIATYPQQWAEAHDAEGHEDRFMNYQFVGGETRRAMQDRSFAALQDIASAGHSGEVAVVTHGGTIRMLLRKLAGPEIDRPMVHISNTSVTTIETDGTHHRVLAISETHHLSDAYLHEDQGEANA